MDKKIKTMLHISHNDADGMVPSAILESMLGMDIIRKDTNVSWMLKSFFIHPAKLFDTLKQHLSDDVDYVVITDLYISLEVLELLSNYIGIERTLICDHHEITYSMEDVYKIYSAEQDQKKIELLHRNIIIANDYNNVQTCATTLFTSLGIYTLDEIFDTELIHKIVTKDYNSYNDNIFTDTAKLCGYIRKLEYVSEITRLRDTFEFVDNLSDRRSIDSDYLYLSTVAISQEEFVSFIVGYLDNPWYIGDDLFQPEQEGTNYYLSKNSLMAIKIEDLIIERNKAINYAKNTMRILPFFEKTGMYEKRRSCAVVIRETHAFSSEIGYQILSEYPNIDFVLIFDISGSAVELRSRKNGNFDCSQIARVLGGNGHKSAAGFPVSRDKNYKIIDGVFAEILLEN